MDIINTVFGFIGINVIYIVSNFVATIYSVCPSYWSTSVLSQMDHYMGSNICK